MVYVGSAFGFTCRMSADEPFGRRELFSRFAGDRDELEAWAVAFDAHAPSTAALEGSSRGCV